MSTDNQAKVGMKYRKLNVAAKRAVIKSRQRRYDRAKIASALGYNEVYVGNVINGHYPNERIVNYAYNMVRSRKKNSDR